MPSQTLKVRKSSTLPRRPKQRIRVGNDASFLGRNWAKRAGAWARLRILPLLGLMALLSLGTHLISAPEYRINEVRLKGSALVQADELFRLVALQNQPALLVRREQAEESLMKLKAIQSASVRLEFPNRAIIDVVERPPAYIWKVKDTLFLASEDGIILGTANAVNQSVALVDVEGKDVTVGDSVDVQALQTAKMLSRVLPEALSITPAYFEYSQAEGIVLPTDFAGRVAFGTSAGLEKKVATLRSLRQTFQEQKLKVNYVDLRFEDRPYFR